MILNNSFNKLKYLFFLIVIIPYITYTYSATIPMLYMSNVLLPIGIIFGFILIKFRYKFDDYLLFLPFLLFIVLQAVLFDRENLIEAIKYILFFIVYAFLFKPHFRTKQIYKTYINFIVIISIFSLLLYFLNFFMDFSFFEIENITQFLSPKSALLTRDWGYQTPFYLFVNSFNQSDGLFGIPRLFGISHEPTAFAAFVMPSILLAYHLNKRYSAIILLTILLIVSSYGALLFFLIAVGVIYGHKYKIQVWILFLFVILGLVYVMGSNSVRITLYLNIFQNFLSQNIMLINTFSFEPIITGEYGKSVDVPVVLKLAMKYGIIAMVLFLYIIFVYILRIIKIKDKILLGFFVSFVLMLDKSQLAFSPLFFFYLSYIDFSLYRKQLHEK